MSSIFQELHLFGNNYLQNQEITFIPLSASQTQLTISLKAVFDWAWPDGRNKGNLPDTNRQIVPNKQWKVIFLKDSSQKY